MLRAAGLLVAIVAGAGTWAALNATELRARFAAQKLATATTDDERAKWADALAGSGEPGVRKLLECVQTGDEPARAAAGAAIEKHLTALTDGGARAVTVSGAILDAFPSATDPGKSAVLRLVPVVLKRTGGAHAARCRGIVAAGLKMPDVETRLAAVRLVLHPDIKLRAEVVPLLAAPEPELRAAALFAVASAADGEALIADEELFRWLHDADAGVRKVCHDALVARDRSDAEIALGRRLTHSDPTERLKLLLDLRYDDDVADPEPWLERLSRDPEPAVRAGAARVAVEIATDRKLTCPVWVGRVADADAHPTVRFVAAHYRGQPTGAPGGHVRPAGGP
jgi:hypothetical protein